MANVALKIVIVHFKKLTELNMQIMFSAKLDTQVFLVQSLKVVDQVSNVQMLFIKLVLN
jgi:hypothetical protein